MGVNRRQVLIGIGGIGIGIPLISWFLRRKRASEYSGESIDRHSLSDNILTTMERDFEIVHRVSAEEAKSLEAYLDEGYGPPPQVEGIEVSVKNFPQFIHAFLIETQKRDGSSTMKLTAMAGGSTYIFHEEGYLLFNYHALEDILATYNIKDTVVVFHDPQKGVGYEVKILSYSKTYDIVLGKIDIPKRIYTNTPMMKEEPAYPDFVYTCVLGNSKAIIAKVNELLNKLFKENAHGICESLKISIDDLGFDVFVGRVVNQFKSMDGYTDKFKPGMRAYLPEQSAPFSIKRDAMDFLTFGNSGTPVFNVYNQLTGIVSELLIPKSGEIGPRAVVFTGPVVIREMLRNYANDCLSK